jgi:uncharacterized protein
MKPFRKNVAIAIDGGGIRGAIVTRALAILEESLGKPVYEIFQMAAGTSTGSIIAAAIAAKISAKELNRLYVEMGAKIFPKTLRKVLFPLFPYRYPGEPLIEALEGYFGNRKMGDLWLMGPKFDLVITTFDLALNRTRFVKPWKEEYVDWPITRAVQGSCTVPTYFPIVEGRYIDGGVGSYANPCYLAAYEAKFCLNWDPKETTLISLGTGRDPYHFNPQKVGSLFSWDWIFPMFGAFLQSAYDQQVHLVDTFFADLDFRRFQVPLANPIDMDNTSQLDTLLKYGEIMGQMIQNDEIDAAQGIIAGKAVSGEGLFEFQ